ncbi:MAG: hypothetical protein CSA13_01545 [Clostridiales bacterium]|nr:MAG: hypothetical protein CSA13_01545 [Clostridiales bacterium]
MNNIFMRTSALIGEARLKKLNDSHVVVVGIGGVGSYVAEGLARSGVGKLTLIDDDVVAASNINRQIQATALTVGRAKVTAMKERLLTINPKLVVCAKQVRYSAENAAQLIAADCDYAVDAIDMVSAKIHLIHYCKTRDIRIISSMGTGNKLDPGKLTVCDLYETTIDPLARVMRRELRKLGVDSLKVVYSDEPPITPQHSEQSENEKHTPGSIAFVPSVAGLMIAGEVVRELIE